MHKIKPWTFTAGSVKSNFKGFLKGLLQVTMHFLFWDQSKEQQHIENSFYILLTVKWLEIPSYFITFSFNDLR